MIMTNWQAYHGLSATDYQAKFNQLTSQGYRLYKVSGYPRGNEARYAGIWVQHPGGRWSAKHGISAAAYQQEITQQDRNGFRPTHVSVFNLGSESLFSAIWEEESKNGFDWIARHGLTPAEYQQLFNDLSGTGYRLRCVSGYSVNGEVSYACIWDQYAGPAWQGCHGLDTAAHQHAFDDLTRRGFRPISVAGYTVREQALFASVWEQSPGRGFKARHGLPESGYQAEFDTNARAGLMLVDVSGYQAGAAADYTTIWEDLSADREDDAVSQNVIPFMKKWAVPGLSLAVARNGTVIAARCFGDTNPITRELVTPQTRFRIASVTKPITATAVFDLIQRSKLALADKIFGSGARLGTKYGTTPYGANISNITLQNLLEHASGGWPKGPGDPMFSNPALSTSDLISWVLNNVPLTNNPGRVFAYSNFGYCLLGRVIETVTGLSYGDFVRQQILARCGVMQMILGGNTAGDRQYPEALYRGQNGESPYGMRVDRMDSHGGWIGTPSDLIQFLLRVDSFLIPPDILQVGTITAMTTASTVDPPTTTSAGYARGWAVNLAGTRWHIGDLPGTTSVMVRTANQHEWAALCNTRDSAGAIDNELDTLMWKVDGALP